MQNYRSVLSKTEGVRFRICALFGHGFNRKLCLNAARCALCLQPRVLFCDWPEVMGPFFMEIWPRLEGYRMDILHAIMRVTRQIAEDHPFRGKLPRQYALVQSSSKLVCVELEQVTNCWGILPLLTGAVPLNAFYQSCGSASKVLCWQAQSI